ncbi:MAG: ATP-dependent zinc metalloprotease FtsH [Prevotellaceae bacterium]|jgi:cell division protease FtsH|nr:ATP-dependent zinc metalloprotease FtsH [Prevotellaceae bacterium]
MNTKSQATPSPKNFKGFKFPGGITWVYAAIAVVLFSMWVMAPNATTNKEVPYSTFKTYMEKGYVEKLLIVDNKRVVQAYIKETSLSEVFSDKQQQKKGSYVEARIPSNDKLEDVIAQYNFTGDYTYEDSRGFWDSVLSFLPFIIFIGIWFYLMRGMSGGLSSAMGGIFNVGRSKAQLFDKENGNKKITFADVAGLVGAKQEIEEIVSFLKNPTKYTELGGKIPKGALLVGPPGTGKTLLAKAVAGEADVPFFSLSGSDFVEMFVGVGASRVRDLFAQAKEKSPCIIFIDEIDAVGRARAKNPNYGGNDERENTLNQLLTEMDGFGTNSGIIILAATNRADMLDKALLRAGRFDRQIHVELPDVNERKAIFKVHLRPVKVDDSIDIDFLARQTPGFSGADIANVCNEAALIAARKGKTTVEKQDFLDAVDRIIGGLEKKSKIITTAEKRAIAYHEAGHATVSWKLRFANPLVKVTIVPRGKALGAAWYLPEERQLTTKEQMLDEICATLGGRAAEEVFFNEMSTGALNDLERVTKLAYAIISYYGMSGKLANVSYYDSSGSFDFGFSKPYSEKTAEMIDAEVKALIEEQYSRAKDILRENSKGHNELATLLIEREVIFSEDVEKIFGKRPWISRTEELIKESPEDIEAETKAAKEIEEKLT